MDGRRSGFLSKDTDKTPCYAASMCCAGRMQDTSARSCPYPSSCSEILPDAHAAAGRLVTHPDTTEQPTDGRGNEGRNAGGWTMLNECYGVVVRFCADKVCPMRCCSMEQAMGMMNRSMNLPAVQKIMREFERESAAMDMKDEMMGDAIDEAMDDDAEGVGEEEEGDAILKEVLDEIGVGLNQQVCKGMVQRALQLQADTLAGMFLARRDAYGKPWCQSSSTCRACGHRRRRRSAERDKWIGRWRRRRDERRGCATSTFGQSTKGLAAPSFTCGGLYGDRTILSYDVIISMHDRIYGGDQTSKPGVVYSTEKYNNRCCVQISQPRN